MSQRVLVTGITGYIGQHCGAELLRQGYTVVGTTRSAARAEAVRKGIAAVAPVDDLHCRELDLLEDAGWDDAVRDCDHVLHVASPYVLAVPDDEEELIRPAVEGTVRVIEAAQRAGVKRTVLTSSVAAIMLGHGSGSAGPDTWSDTDADIGAYARSKTLAERAAWEAVQSGEMELTVINPGVVLGPTLTGEVDGESLKIVSDMITGKMPMVPDVGMGMVDVRDVARLHVAAMTADDAAGRRFIAASAEPVEMVWAAGVLKDAGWSKASTRRAPGVLMRIIGLFDRNVRGMRPYLGHRVHLDNSATLEVLGWEPTPMATSIEDTARSITA